MHDAASAAALAAAAAAAALATEGACAGTFKQQHDTGQNLKYVIVYPRVACSAAPTGGESADAGTPAAKTPQSIMCSADLDTFKKRVASKVGISRKKKGHDVDQTFGAPHWRTLTPSRRTPQAM
eukprot:342083-Chlamydomonas_euryale.AAC.4